MPGLQLLPFLSYLGKTNWGVKLPPPTQIRVKESELKITIKTTLHIVNFLDITLDLRNNT